MQYLGYTYTKNNLFFIWNVNVMDSPVFYLATSGSTLLTKVYQNVAEDLSAPTCY